MKIKQGYSYDDLLLVPKYSEVESRSDVDLSVDLGKGIFLEIPIISANMKDVSGWKMCREMALLGGMGLLHRFCSIQEQCEEYYKATQGIEELRNKIGISVGVKDEEFDRVDELLGKYHAKICCLDIAYGFSSLSQIMCKYISEKYPDVLLIAGNVATPEGAAFLAENGADVIKLNIGNGSSCSTRIQTGNGVPSMTCISEAYDWKIKNNKNVKFIADGGIKNFGDVCKALCFTDCVMIGSMIAGTDETPNNPIVIDGKYYKQYNGSSTLKTKNVEGVKGFMPYIGPVKDIINNLCDALRSGCSYQGVFNLDDLKKNPEFVSISSAGIQESYPHSLTIVNK